MTTITYDPAAITAENLKQYDALFLDSTTGEFLDDPTNKAATQARRQALLDFVKGGKGLAGIHAATDSYHTSPRPASPGAAVAAPTGTWPEFNEMIGGFFKFHWTYPTLIPVKTDDQDSPLTSMFPARGLRTVLAVKRSLLCPLTALTLLSSLDPFMDCLMDPSIVLTSCCAKESFMLLEPDELSVRLGRGCTASVRMLVETILIIRLVISSSAPLLGRGSSGLVPTPRFPRPG